MLGRTVAVSADGGTVVFGSADFGKLKDEIESGTTPGANLSITRRVRVFGFDVGTGALSSQPKGQTFTTSSTPEFSHVGQAVAISSDGSYLAIGDVVRGEVNIFAWHPQNSNWTLGVSINYTEVIGYNASTGTNDALFGT